VIYWKKGKRHQRTPIGVGLAKGHKVRLPGLDPGADFRFRPVSADAAGNAAKGRIKRFTTDG
jgi:hypothetical protein